MELLAGPFVEWESFRYARKKRNYMWRSAYAAILFISMIAAYMPVWFDEFAQMLFGMQRISPLAMFASRFFLMFSLVQLCWTLLLTPSLIAPILASDKQNGLIPALLTTELSGWEILCGRVFVRLAAVWLFVLAGIPIICLSSICGGIDLGQLVLLTFLTLATTFAAAGFSAFVSAYTSSPGRAIARAYFWLALFLTLPLLAEATKSRLPSRSAPHDAFAWLQQAAADVNPFVIYQRSVVEGWSRESLAEFRPYAAFCLLVGGGFLLWGALRTRERCRREEMGKSQRRGLTALQRLRRRFLIRQMGDNPMIWKDWYFERRSAGRLSIAAFLCFALIAGFFIALESTRFSNWTGAGLWDPQSLNEYLQTAIPMTATVVLAAAAIRGANAFSSERKENCLNMLLLTELTPRQIVLAKWVCALKPAVQASLFFLPGMIVAVILGGIALSAALLLGGAVAVYAMFIASFSVYCSLRWKSPGIANAVSICGLFALIGGAHYLILVWLGPPTLMAFHALGVAAADAFGILMLGHPGALLNALTYRTAYLPMTVTSILSVVFAAVPLAAFAWLSLFILQRMSERFSEYCGRSDEGENRSISDDEVKGLASIDLFASDPAVRAADELLTTR